MSYCRFSCDDFQCDLYVYEDDCGLTVHVAKYKRVFSEALPPKLPMNHPGFMDRYLYVQKKVEEADLVPLDLPYAGETFWRDTPEATVALLYQLRGIGYRFPDGVIEALEKEKEEPNAVNP